MNRKIFYIIPLAILFLMTSFSAGADECVVKSSSADDTNKSSLTGLLKKVWQDGACRVDSLTLRKRYSKYIKSDGPFHVIRFKNSMDIFTNGLPALHGKGGLPLVIVADAGKSVRILGNVNSLSEGLIIRGGSGSVVIDNLLIEGFGASGVRIDSDQNLLIDVEINDNGYGAGFGSFSLCFCTCTCCFVHSFCHFVAGLSQIFHRVFDPGVQKGSGN